MQTILCALIVCAAILYVANRWLPTTMKQRLLPWLATKQPASGQPAEGVAPAAGSCGSCSSCGNCGSASTKMVRK